MSSKGGGSGSVDTRQILRSIAEQIPRRRRTPPGSPRGSSGGPASRHRVVIGRPAPADCFLSPTQQRADAQAGNEAIPRTPRAGVSGRSLPRTMRSTDHTQPWPVAPRAAVLEFPRSRHGCPREAPAARLMASFRASGVGGGPTTWTPSRATACSNVPLSSGGGVVFGSAGTPRSTKSCSKPPGIAMVSTRAFCEVMTCEWGTPRGSASVSPATR